ncbi:MAG: methyltransferase domain-containing protein [Erysipelotrichaceae bacterium]|nr:methyltransferase domain-containing protein [Erysipelotrichaceae bacterium]MDY5252850.1 methyltransferase domain-containing protein [Erysipelotrichaceae bacterium]
MKYKCPICNEELSIKEKVMVCAHNHSFDMAKSGYFNLFITNSTNHGDNDLMAKARRDFLAKEYYLPLKQAIIQCISDHKPENLLDLACGEGYYTKDFPVSDKCGIDLSKKAINIAAKQDKATQYIIASIFKTPLYDQSIACITTIFAPVAIDEIKRLLKTNGIFILVTPGIDHLYELKEAVYDEPYKNEETSFIYDSLDISEIKKVKGQFTLTTNTDIKNLFTMTPYYLKTSRQDAAKLDDISQMTITYDFNIHIFKKR